VVQQLLDGDPGFARIAQRLRPWNEIERMVVECHPARHVPCWLCSEAMARTMAQTAFEQDATRPMFETELLRRVCLH
jgi:hypothetical protein